MRLLCLYSIRYENDDKLFQIKEALRKQGLKDEELRLSDLLVEFAGKTKRSGDLFNNKNLAAKGRSLISGLFKEVKDVFSQHKPQMTQIVDNIIKGKLKIDDFPCTEAQFDQKWATKNVIVFVLGGVTFEEERDIATTFNADGNVNVIVGGNTIHNSKTFLADMTRLHAGAMAGL